MIYGDFKKCFICPHVIMTVENRVENTITVVNRDLLVGLVEQARKSERKRRNYNLHNLEDSIQRFFNAIEPGTYVRPHRHLNPPKVETFIHIQGNFSVIFFNDEGVVSRVYEISEKSGNRVVDILPGVWHSIVSHEPGTVYFEVKDGPYIAVTDKDFASWAPEEGSLDAGNYLDTLKSEIIRLSVEK